jgi:hypothetical protein
LVVGDFSTNTDPVEPKGLVPYRGLVGISISLGGFGILGIIVAVFVLI